MAGESFVSLALTPVSTAGEIRELSGFVGIRDVSDAEIERIILRAQVTALSEIGTRVHGIRLQGTINGVNTVYGLPAKYRHRILLDVDSSGGESNDLTVYLRSQNFSGSGYTYSTAGVSSVDPVHSQITLSAAPASASVSGLFLSGILIGGAVTLQLFKEAVGWMAAHMIDVRVRQPGNIPLANPSVAGKDQKTPANSFLDNYRHVVQLMQPTMPQAASVRTRMGASWCDLGYPPECC